MPNIPENYLTTGKSHNKVCHFKNRSCGASVFHQTEGCEGWAAKLRFLGAESASISRLVVLTMDPDGKCHHIPNQQRFSGNRFHSMRPYHPTRIRISPTPCVTAYFCSNIILRFHTFPCHGRHIIFSKTRSLQLRSSRLKPQSPERMPTYVHLWEPNTQH